MQNRLDHCLPHVGIEIVELGRIVPGHTGTVVAVIDVACIVRPAVSALEDHSRVRQGFASENLAVIRQLVLNLLKQEKTAQCGIQNKRLRCAWDVDYRMKVLQGLSSLC